MGRRKKLLGKLISMGPLVVGNVYDVMRRCGNRYCHCAVKPGHRQTLLIYTEKGRRHCKLVRRKDEERIKQAWLRYGNFRKALGGIRTLNQRELALLRAEIKYRSLRYE
ncbi:MAG: hypothetical protein HYS58_00460 [Elusimicrobia bacterium]|nr:hypothetical protein [Elusimicrobiota bacterium]